MPLKLLEADNMHDEHVRLAHAYADLYVATVPALNEQKYVAVTRGSCEMHARMRGGARKKEITATPRAGGREPLTMRKMRRCWAHQAPAPPRTWAHAPARGVVVPKSCCCSSGEAEVDERGGGLKEG